jgi:hypothetical protein
MSCIARGAARVSLLSALFVSGGVLCSAPAEAGAFSSYGGSYRSFSLPLADPGNPFGVKFDALPDGRLLAASGSQIFIEDSVRSGMFSALATIDGSVVDGVDPSFVRVSPDGSRAALGGGFGRPLLVFGTAALDDGMLDSSDTSVFNVGNFDADWADNDSLAISSGAFGQPSLVSLLDVTSDPTAPSVRVIIDNIQGASGGVAFDAAGNLYTGNGFASGVGSGTGTLKAFAPNQWANGVADFEAEGTLIGDFLSANGLHFDLDGNLFVGGGDFSDGDAGDLAILRGSALTASLGGAGPIPSFDPIDVRRLDPLGDGSGFYGSIFNDATGELLIVNADTVFATIPAPSAALGFALLGLAATCRGRRGGAAS